MRYYQSFPTAIPQKEAGYPRVTHPSATKIKSLSENFSLSPFDLHVLGTPPAFILSQDQTLILNVTASSDAVKFVPVQNNSVVLSVILDLGFRSLSEFILEDPELQMIPYPLRNLFRVAFLLNCQLFDCEDTCC